MARKRAVRPPCTKNESPAPAKASRGTLWAVVPASVTAVVALVYGSGIIKGAPSAGDSGVSAPASVGSWTTVSSNCGIEVHEDFLSGPEIEHLLGIVNRTGGWHPSMTGGRNYLVPKGQGLGDHVGPFDTVVAADPIVYRIEQRIAAVTGIPIHPDEDMVSLAKIKTQGRAPRGGYFVPFGLHHDSDTRPNRARTLLVYLTDVPAGGGRTVFPLCTTDTSPPASRSGSAFQLQTELAAALGGLWGGPTEEYGRHASFDVNMDHPFNDALAAACQGKFGVGVAPKRGRAIMFDSMIRGKYIPVRDTWHAGCNVLGGQKVILQKFKELPMADRNPVDAEYGRDRNKKYIPVRG